MYKGPTVRKQVRKRNKDGRWRKKRSDAGSKRGKIMTAPISEEGYNRLDQGVKNWIEQDLKWKREEIVSYHIGYEMIKTDANDEEWARWRNGQNANVTVKNLTQEKQSHRFIRLDNGDWQKEKA